MSILVNGESVSGLGYGRTFDPNAPFKISDSDEASNPSYFGNLSAEGKWFILKINTVDSSYRYARGLSDYPTAWANRTSLAYSYFTSE